MILASGLTGDLGAAVLQQLGQPVQALLRGRDAEARAQGLSRRAGVPVTPVAGDVTRPLWGIDRARRRDLEGEVSVVLNLAAETTWSARWEHLEEVNVVGARHAVDLAYALGARLVHVSSLFAAYDAEAVVPQALVTERDELTKYERSKCRGEWIVAESRTRYGTEATIARIAGVVGDLWSTAGPARQRTPILRLLRQRQWPFMPLAPHARVDIVPRDVAAAALVRLVQDPAPPGRLVHHIGMGAHAPTVGALAAEMAAVTRGRDRFRSVSVPASWLKEVSSAADRLGRGPTAAAVIGLRYLASQTIYESDQEFARQVTLSDLVRCLGLVPEGERRTDPLPGYYARWTEPF